MSGNPFDDLDGLDDDEEEAERDEPSDEPQTSDGSSSERSNASTDDVGTSSSSSSSAPEMSGDAATTDAGGDSTAAESLSTTAGPAFPYDEVKQRPLYAREEAWNAFEDALELEVERTLREYDVRDATGRELHDAALRVAAEHPEAIANQLLELRGISINQ